MKIQLIPLGLAITLLATSASFADYIQATTNLYAYGAGTNFVDSSARPAPNDLATFSNAVYSAYADNLGGDFHFPTTFTTATVFQGTYGTSGTKRLTFTADRTMQPFAPPAGSFWTVSGNPNGYGITTSTDQAAYNLAIGPISDAVSLNPLSGDKVVKLGFVVCSRTHATYPLDVKATVSYTDGTTESVTSTISAPRTFDDTFYGFTAPGGAGITNLLLESFTVGTTTPVATRIGIDDLGFVTVSEGPVPPVIYGLSPANGAVHWASNGIHFEASSKTDIPTSGVTVLLNSNNVSSQLVISGDPTNRSVSFGGLTANLKYRMDITVSNVAGGVVWQSGYFYTPESSPVTVFDSEGFTNDVLYPIGYLTAFTNSDYYWAPATEPAEIVDLGDGVHNKVLRRQQTGTDYIDYLHFAPVSSGTLTIAWDAEVSSMDGRTLDMSLNGYAAASATQGPFLMWGTNAVNYYNRTTWVALTNLDAGWHHFELAAYVSGSLAGTFDLKVDNATVGQGLVWRVVFSPAGTLRIGAIRGSIVQYGEVDNLVIKVSPEPLAAVPVTLLSPASAGSTFSFSFVSLASINYLIQTNDTLTSTNWSTLQTIAGDGTLKTVTHTNPPAGMLFYRVKSQLP
jgi:hypothetical protein